MQLCIYIPFQKGATHDTQTHRHEKYFEIINNKNKKIRKKQLTINNLSYETFIFLYFVCLVPTVDQLSGKWYRWCLNNQQIHHSK